MISVNKSSDVHSLKKGDTFVRKGRQNAKITAGEIIRLKYEKGAIKYETEKTDLNTLDVIDLTLLEQYKTETGSKNEDNWQFLKDNGLTTGDNKNLTKAAVLLFSKNPTVALGQKCALKISHYYGTKPSFTENPNFVRRPFSIEGPLIYQIEKAMDYFRKVVAQSPPKLRGSGFRPSLLIPDFVFQEAVTNAVIHRNYSIQDDIQIRFFDDRIEVESPGTYPGHINIDNIRSERFTRNPLIQRTLNRFQTAPNLDIGEGVNRMFELMREKNLYEPLYIPPYIRPKSVLVALLNLEKVSYWDTVSKYLDQKGRITNKEARDITGIKDTLKMSRLLKSWVEKRLIERGQGREGKRSVFYTKPGRGLAPNLFSSALDNGNMIL